MRSWRFKVKFKPMNGGNDNKTDTDRKAVIQAMTHTQCYVSGWRIIGALIYREHPVANLYITLVLCVRFCLHYHIKLAPKYMQN